MNSPVLPNHSSARTAIFSKSRALAALALAVAGFGFSGCTTYTPAGNMEMFVRTAPVPALVPHGKELAAAEAHAAKDANSFALVGSGKSMEPMYVSGTAIVVHEQAYTTLRTGMPVVYRNSRGFYVAHMLVEEMRDGWLAIGVNNAEPDQELVTRNNFVGVIQAAYAASDTPFRADVAARVALKDGIDRSAKMALLR
ncbi:MAG: S24/S26 family peptidase [Undibacterium sp.]|nr:S24/S26 family peptidase [Opitutaceae bacterium]